MNCDKFQELIENAISEKELNNPEILCHIEKCQNCKRLYEEQILITKAFSLIEEVEVPSDITSLIYQNLNLNLNQKSTFDRLKNYIAKLFEFNFLKLATIVSIIILIFIFPLYKFKSNKPYKISRPISKTPLKTLTCTLDIRGSATVIYNNGEMKSYNSKYIPLQKECEINVKKGKVIVRFNDNLEVILANARVKLLKNFKSLYIYNGNLKYIHTGNAGPDITIKTPLCDIKALGTIFELNVATTGIKLKVIEGKIQVRSPHFNKIIEQNKVIIIEGNKIISPENNTNSILKFQNSNIENTSNLKYNLNKSFNKRKN